MKHDWHKIVYGKKVKGKSFKTQSWKGIRSFILHRDCYTCIRCDIKFAAHQLSVHHLVPREDGGLDNITNLVTLCNQCHDYVELNHLYTIAEIMGSYDGGIMPVGADTIISDTNRPYWHKYVYGGIKGEARFTGHLETE